MSYTDVCELEKLISNSEFENQQYVKLIEQEHQLTDALDKEISEKQAETCRLQSAISQLDTDTKQCHKQYTFNRDNIESLKKTNHVLTEHVAAMTCKLELLHIKTQEEKQQHDQHLRKYQHIWETYEKTYESMPLAKECKERKKMVEEISRQNTQRRELIQNTKYKLQQIEDRCDLRGMGTNAFIVKMVDMRVRNVRLMEEVGRKKTELNELYMAIEHSKQAASDRENETNLLKLTDMQLVDVDKTGQEEAMESLGQLKQLDSVSPIISMVGERDDDGKVMQTDAVSADQISLQFTATEDLDTQYPHSVVPQLQSCTSLEKSEQKTACAPCLPPSRAPCPPHSPVSSRSHVQSEVPLHAGLPPNPTKVQARTLQPQTSLQTTQIASQMPFVAYKMTTAEPASAQIHIDKAVTSTTHNKPVLQRNQTIVQTPTSQATSERTICRPQVGVYRPYSPQFQTRIITGAQTRPTTQAQTRPTTQIRCASETRPSASMMQSSTPQLLLDRPGSADQALQLNRQPQLQTAKAHVEQTVSRPHIQLPRPPGVSSRLPVLKSPRAPVVNEPHPPQTSVPSMTHNKLGSNLTPPHQKMADSLRMTQSPQHLPATLHVKQSPLQLSSPSPQKLSTSEIGRPPQQIKRSPLQISTPLIKQQSLCKVKASLQLPAPNQQRARTQTMSSHIAVDTVNQSVHAQQAHVGQRPELSPLSGHAQTQLSQSGQRFTQQQPGGQRYTQPQSSGQRYIQPQSSGHRYTQPQSSKQGYTQPQLSEQRNIQPQFSGQRHTPPKPTGSTQTVARPSGPRHTPLQPNRQQVPSVKPAPATPTIPSTIQLGQQIPQPDGSSMYFLKMKDAPATPEKNLEMKSPELAPKIPSKPDSGPIESSVEDSSCHSPFDMAKHRRKLAEMKQSPGHHATYLAPVKRAYTEIENSQETGNENMQLFGQAEGSGCFGGGGGDAGTFAESKTNKTSSQINKDAQSAFSFFASFENDKGDTQSKISGGLFNFGGGDPSDNRAESGSPFSMFGSSINDESSAGFPFSFDDSTCPQKRSKTTNEGNFFSMFGDGGNNEKNNTDNAFNLNFGNNGVASPTTFSFF